MKYTFMNKSEHEASKIIEVLEHYCVPYKTRLEHKDNFLFGGTDEWNIVVDLDTNPKKKDDGTYSDSPLAFILTKVNEALKADKDRESLERAFSRNIIRPALPSEEPKRTIPNTSFESIGSILEKNFKKADENDNTFWGKFKKFLKKEDKLDKFIKPKEEHSDANIWDEVWQDLLQKEGLNNCLPNPLNIIGSLGLSKTLADLTSGEELSFDDLSPEEQAKLSMEHPISLLRSSHCKIRRVKRGNVTALLVSIEM